jgi:hypothetical protein
MKRITTSLVSVLLVATLVLGVSTAMAGKPQNVIPLSNGFPSGMHFNLNIHGKDPNVFTCDSNAHSGGNSIFIDEFALDQDGNPIPAHATIQYVSNKKSNVYELQVLDACAMNDGTAKVQLPYKVLVDENPLVAQGFYVFGRILGKPNNGNDDPVTSIILYPNQVVQACNDNPDEPNPDFGDYTSCDDVPLGLIIGNNLYEVDPEEEQYVRFDPEVTKAKGKSKATDITRLFTYTGWVVDERLDMNKDGVIDESDVPEDAITYVSDLDGNYIIDVEEWLRFQADLALPMAWYFDEEWILNIADLVVTEQGLVNDGTKLLQIRFYPVATTEFKP